MASVATTSRGRVRQDVAPGAGDGAGTRQRLLDKALDLFARHGFAGTSMRMLARAAELRESSIYNHFSGKDDLYRAVLAQWGPAEFVERLRSAEYQALSHDPPAFLRLCVTHIVDRWMDPREHLFAAMINREGPEGEGFKLYHKALFHDEIELLTRYFVQFAKKNGMIAPDPRETARLFTAGLVQIRLEFFSAAHGMPARKDVERATQRHTKNFIAMVFRA